MECPRCKRDHQAVSYTAWAWAVRDTVRAAKVKPPAGQVAVLFILGSHMDPATGCGWTTREGLMRDLGVKRDTVTTATIWALEKELLVRLVRGQRYGDGQVTQSLWALADPRFPPEPAPGAETGTHGKRTPGAETGTVGDSQGRKRALPRAEMGTLISKTRSVRPVGGDASVASTNGQKPPRAGKGAVGDNGSRPASKRGTRIPPDFPDQLRADPRHAEWFRENCPGVDGRVELAQFMDWWTSATGAKATKQDWFATWRNWMRSEQKKTDARKPAGARGQPASDPATEWMVNRS